MTPSTHGPQPPAWYRLLPRPPTEHNPALRRTSSLSQHHLFPDPSPGHTSEEDVPRRNTVHVLKSTNSTTNSATYIAGRHSTTDAVPETSIAAPRSRSLDMAEEPSQPGALLNRPHHREHLCLCPPDPKIPRPRNCEVAHIPLLENIFATLKIRWQSANLCNSVHPISPASTGWYPSGKPRHSKSGGVKDHW